MANGDNLTFDDLELAGQVIRRTKFQIIENQHYLKDSFLKSESAWKEAIVALG